MRTKKHAQRGSLIFSVLILLQLVECMLMLSLRLPDDIPSHAYGWDLANNKACQKDMHANDILTVIDTNNNILMFLLTAKITKQATRI